MTKLTTDLIADCMALIPENLERLNENQNYFYFEKYNLKFLDSRVDDFIKVIIISHCLRIIPEFQTEIKALKEQLDEEQKQLEYYKSKCKEQPSIAKSLYCEIQEKRIDLLNKEYKTIAAATLHGQGEFPPSTLEELCESYKNVTSR